MLLKHLTVKYFLSQTFLDCTDKLLQIVCISPLHSHPHTRSTKIISFEFRIIALSLKHSLDKNISSYEILIL